VSASGWQTTQNWARPRSRDAFPNFGCSLPIYAVVKLDISNVDWGLSIEILAYAWYYSKGCVQDHVTFQHFGKLASISRKLTTVQDRHSYNGSLIENHMLPTDWYQYQWPWMMKWSPNAYCKPFQVVFFVQSCCTRQYINKTNTIQVSELQCLCTHTYINFKKQQQSTHLLYSVL